MRALVKFRIILLVIFFVSISSLIRAEGIKRFGATLFFNDGTTDKLLTVTSGPGYDLYRNCDSLIVNFKGERLKVPLSDVREMTVIRTKNCGFRLPYICDYDFDLKLRNGKSFIVTVGHDIMRDIIGKKINPLTNKIITLRFSWGVRHHTLRKVIFSTDVGRTRINPITKRIWPSYYNYDPETGEKLIWADIK